MANPEHLAILNQGVEAWNAWRQSAPSALAPDLRAVTLVSKELAGANFRGTNFATSSLKGANLTGADLRKADLTWASLQGANLTDAALEDANLTSAILDATERTAPPINVTGTKFDGVNLAQANLQGVDLHGKNFRGINLQGANLKQANLLGAQLREADLRDTDLSTAKGGLRPEQLAGADLTGATLPSALNDLFKDLKAVGDISESARKLFVAMLAACLYSWLTIATTTDVNLITNRASSPLPIIQTSIPIVGFYVVAPLLLLCIYFYFHFYLQKLWEELGSLPAIFPDGRPLHARSDPWLLNDLVRSHLARLKADRPFMSYFQQGISMVLAWWLVPVTLFFFWGRYLPRHDFVWTTVQVVLLAISMTGAIRLYHLAAATLRGNQRRFFWGTRTLTSLRAYGAFATFLVTGVVFMVVSVGAIRGVPSDSVPGKGYPWPKAYGPDSWVPRAMALVHYSPFADFTDADVSVKPPNWTGKSDSELDLVKGAELSNAGLQYAGAVHAFLAKALLTEAHLEGAGLIGSDLRGSELRLADLTGAHLQGADLRGANLAAARLTGAQMDRSQLRKASLLGADMSQADLSDADLSDADLTGAYLAGADLMGTNLSEADLHFADLREVVLTDADLRFADLRGVRGVNAADLTFTKNRNGAYYDDNILRELGLPPDHNNKLAEEQKREEEQMKNPSAAGSTGAPVSQKPPRASGKQANPNQGNR